VRGGGGLCWLSAFVWRKHDCHLATSPDDIIAVKCRHSQSASESEAQMLVGIGVGNGKGDGEWRRGRRSSKSDCGCGAQEQGERPLGGC